MNLDFASDGGDPQRYSTLGIVLSALFVVVFDFFIINLAAPSIQADLHASAAQVRWFVAGYCLAYAVCLITCGRLGDIIDRKRMFMTGLASFITASALCGLTRSPEAFIAARVLLGVAAAVMQPQVLAIIQVSFPVHERARAFGFFGGAMGLASITGQLAGGWLIQANLFGCQWRPAFFFCVPIGLLALLAAAQRVPESCSPTPLRLDLPGVALAVPTLLALMVPLVQGRGAGWPPWMLACLGAAVPLLLAFAAHQAWKTRRQAMPLVDLRLFADRSFTLGLLVTIVFYFSLSAFFLVFSLFLQNGYHLSTTQTALACVPYSITMTMAALCSARMIRTFGSYALAAGAGVMIASLLLLLHTVDGCGSSLTVAALMPAMALYGLGQGTIASQLNAIVLAAARPENAGSAAGVLTTTQQLVCAAGVGVIGNVYSGALSERIALDTNAYLYALHAALLGNIGVLVVTMILARLLRTVSVKESSPRASIRLHPRDNLVRGAL